MRITMISPVVICSVFLFLYECQALSQASLLNLAKVSSDSTGNCEIQKFKEEDWNVLVITDSLNDTSDTVGKQIYTSNYENIVNSNPSCSSVPCFFKIVLDESIKTLSIVATEKLLEIDGFYETIQDSPKEISTTIQLQCENGTRQLNFKVSVNDTNNHHPTFGKINYEYILPMPIPPTIDLTQFGEKIYATDLDFSNKNIEFSTDLDGLKCNTVHEADSKQFFLRLEFTKTTRFSDKKTIILTGTDSGKPSLSNTTIVTFNIDENNSEPYIPKFKEPSFMYEYNPDTQSISAVNEEVTLVEDKDDIKCEFVGDLAPYFNVPTKNGETINISINKKFPDEIMMKTATSVSLNCYVKSDFPSMSDVIILFPEDVKSNAAFSKAAYTAKLSVQDDEQKVVMDDRVSIENYVEDVDIKVETYAKYFEIVDSGDKTWYLSKKSDVNLDSSDLQHYSLDVIISLVVRDNNRVLDKAVVTVLLPNGETRISFTAPVFNGTYTFDKKNGDKLTIESTVSLNSKYFEFQNAFLNEYPDNFRVSFESPDTFKIDKIVDLPQDLLKQGSVLLTLHVDFNLAGVDQYAESALLLYLSEDSDTTTTEKSTSTSSSTEESTSTSSSTEKSTSTSSSTEESTSTSSSTEKSTSTSSSTEESTSTSSSTEESTTHSATTGISPITTSEPPNECDDNNTVWIIIVVLLCLILVCYVCATVFYYFKKLRNTRNLSELPQPATRVEPLFQKRLSHDHKLKEVSTRRPTGFIRYNPDLEEGSVKDDEEVNNNTASNKMIQVPVENTKKMSGSGKNVGFADAAGTKPSSLAEELKQAVESRESRLI